MEVPVCSNLLAFVPRFFFGRKDLTWLNQGECGLSAQPLLCSLAWRVTQSIWSQSEAKIVLGLDLAVLHSTSPPRNHVSPSTHPGPVKILPLFVLSTFMKWSVPFSLKTFWNSLFREFHSLHVEFWQFCYCTQPCQWHFHIVFLITYFAAPNRPLGNIEWKLTNSKIFLNWEHVKAMENESEVTGYKVSLSEW